MKTQLYFHNNIQLNQISKNVIEIIENLNFDFIYGCGNELRKLILTEIQNIGWSNEFILSNDSNISLTSKFNDHILCLQTGNMSRFYADLIKIQYVYCKGNAQACIYILPSKTAAKIIGSNIANFERFTLEINMFKDIITTPILVIGVGK